MRRWSISAACTGDKPQATRNIPDEKQTETRHKKPTQKQAANTSGRISEEGMKNPTGNAAQATETPSTLPIHPI